MNLMFLILLVSFLKKFEDGSVDFYSIIIILFQWNNGCCFFFRYGYSTTNHDMCYPFDSVIIVFVRSLLNSYIITILLTVVLYCRLWLVIWGITLIIIFPIMILSFFPETICIWNYYILANRWWPGTNNFNGILFQGWLFPMFVNIFGRS